MLLLEIAFFHDFGDFGQRLLTACWPPVKFEIGNLERVIWTPFFPNIMVRNLILASGGQKKLFFCLQACCWNNHLHFADFNIFQRKSGFYIQFWPENVLVYPFQGRAELYLIKVSFWRHFKWFPTSLSGPKSHFDHQKIQIFGWKRNEFRPYLMHVIEISAQLYWIWKLYKKCYRLSIYNFFISRIV